MFIVLLRFILKYNKFPSSNENVVWRLLRFLCWQIFIFLSKSFHLHPHFTMKINELQKSIEFRDDVRVEIYQALHRRQSAVRNFCNQILFFRGTFNQCTIGKSSQRERNRGEACLLIKLFSQNSDTGWFERKRLPSHRNSL